MSYEGSRRAEIERLMAQAMISSFRHSAAALRKTFALESAGALGTERDASEAVAADPAVIDTEHDAAYRHGVEHHEIIATRSRVVTRSTWSEADRQAWLRRVQADR